MESRIVASHSDEAGSISGISGSTIKIIAIISMLIDHTAVVFFEGMLEQGKDVLFGIPLMSIYYGMRSIGRLGFPIFIFLMVEGLEHTRNKWKYLLRLLLFAAVSEIPFDMAFNLGTTEIFSGRLIEFGYQNVFFTLAIGLLVCIGIQAAEAKPWNPYLKVLLNFAMAAAGMALAEFLQTDYAGIGVLAIVIMYLLRRRRIPAVAASCLILLLFSSVLEVFAFLILLPVGFYNGKRGLKLKWVFYIFYPAHLLILWLIAYQMGLR